MNQAVTLTFSLKYLVNFSKSSSLSKKVQLMMSNDVPLLVRLILRFLYYWDVHGADTRVVAFCRCRTHSTRASSGTTSHPKSATTSRRLITFGRARYRALFVNAIAVVVG